MTTQDPKSTDVARTQIELIELVRIEVLLALRQALSLQGEDLHYKLEALQRATCILNDLDPLRARFSLGTYAG
ncbi:MAG: hypothetical protein U1A78_32140 [Polyangia bacterium]